MIEQKNLFSTPPKQAPLVSAEPTKSAPSLPSALELLNPGDYDSVMWLRMLAYRSIRANDEKTFLKAIKGEMLLKSGKRLAHFVVKEALLVKNFTE